MKRIVVIGCSGAGKSTLSRRIAEKLGLPLFHLDQMSWSPGWVEIDREIFDQKLAKVLSKRQWVVDGNFGRTMEWRIQRSDTIVFLDFPRRLCLYRVLKRVYQGYGKTRPDMGEGCPERFDFGFLKWVWKYNDRDRGRTLEKIERSAKGKRVYQLTSPKQVEAFMAGLK
jgi:adenylate kinase family enzyme